MGENILEKELPVPEAAAPQKCEFFIDMLVVGSGYAGIPAAVTAKKKGINVMIADKGNLAYSGASPWAQCYQFFNADFGDDAEKQLEYTKVAGEYIANLDWYKVYLEESYDAFRELCEWGIFRPFPKASACEPDYYHENRKAEYHSRFREYDRRLAWKRLVEENGIPYVNNTMITKIILQDGKVAGAAGFDVPSGTPMIFHAKSVILATGCGIYKNSGYPMAGNGFDGEYMCYQLGLPIVGREFDWHNSANSACPGAGWSTYSWGWLENLHATAGMSQFGLTIEKQAIKSQMQIGMLGKLPDLKEGIKPLPVDAVGFVPLANAALSTDPENDPRKGNDTDQMPKRDALGAAIGLGGWKDSGVFCGLDDLEGYTGIPGLYVAGDANGSMMFGAVYTPGQGGSLPVSHIQGKRAASAAALYCKTAESPRISAENIEFAKKEILEPMNREKGMDPRWARDLLHSIMAPYWVSIAKNEESLRAALVSVKHLKDEVVPILMAKTSHDLRLVHEMRAKVCDAYIKLLTALERKESRGTHYRTDYPYRDDENFLCYITARKGPTGEVILEKVPVKPEWTGDTKMDYEKRYFVHYPGEEEARAKGGR